mmetsp:Transcript_23342/g.33936  ORF Transcript_23342/g.33936 Transcript_23342/m.33936 type:complete len:116 (-) Transcript_23342:177-524(-)
MRPGTRRLIFCSEHREEGMEYIFDAYAAKKKAQQVQQIKKEKESDAPDSSSQDLVEAHVPQDPVHEAEHSREHPGVAHQSSPGVNSNSDQEGPLGSPPVQQIAHQRLGHPAMVYW